MNLLFQYPELVLAGVLSAALLLRRENAGTEPFVALLLDAAKALVYLLPERYLAWLQRNQVCAGWRYQRAFAGLCAVKVYPTILLGALAFVFSPSLSLLVGAILFMIPDAVVFSVCRQRKAQITVGLPQALDLMVLCIDAGLGLDSALHRVAGDEAALTGALSEELRLLNRDILLGMDRQRAFSDLYNRTGVEELRTFGSALNQSSKLGLSIGHVVRHQSEFIRLKQEHRAEERAAKVAIWMVFPLWFCVMPAMMVIVLAPSLIPFFKTLAHFPPEWFM